MKGLVISKLNAKKVTTYNKQLLRNPLFQGPGYESQQVWIFWAFFLQPHIKLCLNLWWSSLQLQENNYD